MGITFVTQQETRDYVTICLSYEAEVTVATDGSLVSSQWLNVSRCKAE